MAADFTGQSEAIVFLSYLRIFRIRGKVVYPLQEILLLCLLAVASLIVAA